MKKTVMKALTVLLAGSMFLEPVETSAEGKTIGAYKCTEYTKEKGSDAKTIYQGVKNYDSNYNGEYLDAASKKLHLLIFMINPKRLNTGQVMDFCQVIYLEIVHIMWTLILKIHFHGQVVN